jgi:hypothetical protein
MKLYNFLYVTILLVLCLSPKLGFTGIKKPKHFVILIHGIGGNKKTFGSLEKILNQDSLDLHTKTFEYRTGSILTTYDFAKELHLFITKILQNEGTGNDQISLIMHSQGGIVGFLWLKYISDNKIGYQKYLSSFITLSTPHWGADMANIGKMFFFSMPEGLENPLSPFGRKELNEMSFGSGTIYDMAQSIDSVFNQFPNLRVLNIGGMKRFHNATIGEDDMVVPAYSMRSERFYLKDEIKLYEKPKVKPISFEDQNFERDFLMIPAEHIKLDQYGVADLPENCLKIKQCDHPALPIILDHLKGQKVEKKWAYELSLFRVTVFVNNINLYEEDNKHFSIGVEGLNELIQIPVIERLSPHRGSAKIENATAFTFSGISKSNEKQKIFITLKHKNTKVQVYEAPIKAGLSTIMDLNLIRD